MSEQRKLILNAQDDLEEIATWWGERGAPCSRSSNQSGRAV